MSFWSFRPYVPVADRRRQAAREIENLKKKRGAVAPVVVEGGKIARSFWGKAWCENLEHYSDFDDRLSRGRSYVRNGSIVDLQVERGTLRALVSGSKLYDVRIDITVAAPSRWKAICTDCAGSVGSLVELLQGKLSTKAMERVFRKGDGLFPAPNEIRMSCSCPDWADMCKHVAATLYGFGARLDAAPDLLFVVRGVDRAQLIATADLPAGREVASDRVLADDDIGALFGIDLAPPVAPSRMNDKKDEGAAINSADQLDPPPGRVPALKSGSSSKRGAERPVAWDEAAKKSRPAMPRASRNKKTMQVSVAAPAGAQTSASIRRDRTNAKAAKDAPALSSEKSGGESRRQGENLAGRTRAAKWINPKACTARRRKSGR